MTVDIISPKLQCKFVLSRGTQVRKEDFGLLFYTFAGPKLFFLPSGHLLDPEFFQGRHSLAQSLKLDCAGAQVSANRVRSLQKALALLTHKGVIVEH